MTAGTRLAEPPLVTRSITIGGSVVVASAIGLALLLRPRPVAHEELPASTFIPATVRQVVKSKMHRHEEQMRTLLSRVVLLDDDGVARAAGEVFDEPALAGPVEGDELNNLLPHRFFVMQDELRAHARQLVIASQKHDHAAVADEFASLAKTCVNCHQVFLYGDSGAVTRTETRP
jgi:hypothetical protein